VEKPLPVAAAYHPSYLRKLRKPVFEEIKPRQATVPNEGEDALQTEAQMTLALREALAKSQADAAKLEPRPNHRYSNIQHKITLQFWEDREVHHIDFEVYYLFLLVMLRSYTTSEQGLRT
jgi:hypothetical protein